jgi:RimJ/RimL family protein N-acetyltransferase
VSRGEGPSLVLSAVETAAEIERVAELAREIWLEYYPPVIGREQAEYMIATLQSAAAIAEQARGRLRYFLLHAMRAGGAPVVEHANSELVGYAAVETRAPALFISKLYLLAHARGHGLGQRALRALSDHARSLGLRRLELTVNRNNRIALDAYARFGMSIVGEQVAEIGGGYVMDDFVLSVEVS